MESLIYTIDDFYKILNDGINIQLSKETLDLINSIASEVGSTDYVKTPDFINIKQNKNYNSAKTIQNNDWNIIRNFKTTTIIKKEGIDASIDEIRKYLNKITDKTYEKILPQIFNEIDKLDCQNIDNIEKIGTHIFTIASSNIIYSKLYANLYSNLVSKYEFIQLVFKEKEESLCNVLNNVYYVSPDENYDLFCKMNNENEKRKALISFFINLVFYDVITVSRIEELLIQLLENLNNLIKEENKKFVVDEYIEIIFILYNKELFNNNNTSINRDNHTKIIENIRYLAGVKVKTYPSLSSKSIFKLMDIVEM